jgi:D-lactate dehydrogenase
VTVLGPVLGALLPLEGVGRDTCDALARGASRIALQPGERLFAEGEASTFLFVVESGALAATKHGPEGREVVLRELGPGELGGLTSLLLERPRSATLVARAPTGVITVSRDRVLHTLDAHPELGRALLVHLGGKVRDKTNLVATLLARAGQDPREQVVFFDAKPYERAAFDARLPESLRLHYVEARLGPATARLARGYPVVCAFVNDVLDASVLEELARFGTRMVALRCAGYNNVDLAAAARVGIEVARVPAYSPHAVAEHAVALLLTLNRKTHRAYGRVREGNFSLTGLVGFGLNGRTAGLVGLGKIGACVARILRGFGMNVLAHDLAPDLALGESLGIRWVSLDELLASSDVVSLHVPLNPSTYHLLDAARLRTMRRGAVLLNTSRGGLVDTAALLDALKREHLGAAGLDVYEEESEYFFRDHSDRVITDDLLARLMTFPNVLVTSHQGFLTTEALDNIAETTLANVRAFLGGARGAELPNRVA